MFLFYNYIILKNSENIYIHIVQYIYINEIHLIYKKVFFMYVEFQLIKTRQTYLDLGKQIVLNFT